MKDYFYAVGYHGADKKHIRNILNGIKFALNKGDKFLGQGFYLWRDSYERAFKWAKSRFNKPTVVLAKIKCKKGNVLNFTSRSWEKEKELINIYLNFFSDMYFGEFLDMIIYDYKENYNLVVVSDLGSKALPIMVDNVTFVFSDTQICVKNEKPILLYGEI